MAAQNPESESVQPIEGEFLPGSQSFARAMEAGTRTLTGEPGPRYWQQRVDYSIQARVDFSVPELKGEEFITYHNDSPNAIDTLGLRLEQNVMKGGAPRAYAMPVTGGMTVTSLRVGGEEISPADTSRVRSEGGSFVGAEETPEVGTLVWIALPRPIPPGGKEEIEVSWSFRIPPGWAPRMGLQDSTTVQMAQWFPQIAVYDDLNGWDRQLYLGTGEFYDEYGDFDVAISVPPGFVVAATGTLTNPDEVLTPEGQKRLKRAAKSKTPVRILAAREFGTGEVLAVPAPAEGETPDLVTWHFSARNVRDFAFAASDHYQWDAVSAVVNPAAKKSALAQTFWRPDRPHADEAAAMAAHAVAFHSAHITPYIYPQISVTDGGSGGMEYPMIVFVEAYPPDAAPREYSLIAHEIAHEWFPMMVGSNETAFGWQDEGLVTFRTLLASRDYSGERAPDLERIRSTYIPFAGSDFERPLMTHSDAFPIAGPWYRLAAYSKPAFVLLVLRDVLGAETFDRALMEYTRRWTLSHPAPQDFFNTFERVAGRDLDWFWRPWFYETPSLDLAIQRVEREPDGRHVVTVVNRDRAPAPVIAEVTLAGGRTKRVQAAADELAKAGTVRLALEAGETPVAVRLDPEERYPDVDRSNDSWGASAQTTSPSGP